MNGTLSLKRSARLAAEAFDAIQPAIYLTAEWPIRDIARAHEAVINVAPDSAVPIAAALARDCIFKVGVAVVMANDFPRKRRADPREQFHRNSPKPTLTLVERYPYRSDIKVFHTLTRQQKACRKP